MDNNLNTHNPGSVYEAFCPQEAYTLTNRLEIQPIPRHGSWLNIAECELDYRFLMTTIIMHNCHGNLSLPTLINPPGSLNA